MDDRLENEIQKLEYEILEEREELGKHERICGILATIRRIINDTSEDDEKPEQAIESGEINGLSAHD